MPFERFEYQHSINHPNIKAAHTLEIIGNKAHMHKYLYKEKNNCSSQEIEEIILGLHIIRILGMQFYHLAPIDFVY